MYLVNESYFQKEYFIPNLNEINSDNAEKLTYFSDKYGRLFMQKLLGYELFKDFDSNMTNGGNLDNNATQKWKDLVNGKEYTNSSGKLVKWRGLLYQDGAFHQSVITPYVYYAFLLDQVSKTTGTGEKNIEAQNATSVNLNQKLITVWNDFVYQYQGTDTIVDKCNAYYYNGVMVKDYFNHLSNDNFVTVIQFLKDNPTDYPEALCQLYNYQNQFGL